MRFAAVTRPETVTRDQCYTDPVANLTLVIDDDVLRRARIRALEQGTSVNAVVREQLARYAGGPDPRVAMQGVLELARKSTAGSGPEGRTWTREDLYEK